jgi:ribosome-binding ATPase YchF (GTP1/OBG family)
MELIFADLEHLERVLPTLQKKAKTGNASKDDKQLVQVLTHIQSTLLEGKLAHVLGDHLSPEDRKLVKSYNFLTLKPFIYALNIAQEDIVHAEALQKEFSEKLQAPVAIVCVKIEEEMMTMEQSEKLDFLAEMFSLEPSAIPTLDDLIGLAFQTLGLMYYFTTGEKETKAWTIPLGSTAPQAAGAIHSDFEKGFIKAEVVSYIDLLSAGSR